MNNWEGFTITSVRPSMSEAVELLNQIEDQGYDPRFMFLTQQGIQVYGRKKEQEHRRLGPRELDSSESELGTIWCGCTSDFTDGTAVCLECGKPRLGT